MNLSWQKRGEHPEPRAAVGIGLAGRRLCRRLQELPDEELSAHAATANRDVLIVIASAERLPWVPDVAYAAPATEAPSLWLPTTLQPEVPLDLLARAALKRSGGRSPVLLWPDPAWLIPLDRQLPVTRGLLKRLYEALG